MKILSTVTLLAALAVSSVTAQAYRHDGDRGDRYVSGGYHDSGRRVTTVIPAERHYGIGRENVVHEVVRDVVRPRHHVVHEVSPYRHHGKKYYHQSRHKRYGHHYGKRVSHHGYGREGHRVYVVR